MCIELHKLNIPVTYWRYFRTPWWSLQACKAAIPSILTKGKHLWNQWDLYSSKPTKKSGCKSIIQFLYSVFTLKQHYSWELGGLLIQEEQGVLAAILLSILPFPKSNRNKLNINDVQWWLTNGFGTINKSSVKIYRQIGWKMNPMNIVLNQAFLSFPPTTTLSALWKAITKSASPPEHQGVRVQTRAEKRNPQHLGSTLRKHWFLHDSCCCFLK